MLSHLLPLSLATVVWWMASIGWLNSTPREGNQLPSKDPYCLSLFHSTAHVSIPFHSTRLYSIPQHTSLFHSTAYVSVLFHNLSLFHSTAHVSTPFHSTCLYSIPQHTPLFHSIAHISIPFHSMSLGGGRSTTLNNAVNAAVRAVGCCKNEGDKKKFRLYVGSEFCCCCWK